jgi:lysophospholipase L1-like esterase
VPTYDPTDGSVPTLWKRLIQAFNGTPPVDSAEYSLWQALITAVENYGGGGGGGAVSTVFGRAGNVVALTGDYNIDQITGGLPQPGSFPRFNRALSRVRSAEQDAKLLLVGDSITYGYGSVQPGIGGAGYIANRFANDACPSAVGIGIPNILGGLGTDTRWSKTSAWFGASEPGWNWGGANASYTALSGTAAETLIFQPPAGVLYDSFDVYHLVGPTFGTFDVQIDFAGAPQAVAGFNLTLGIENYEINGTSALDFNALIAGLVTVNGVTIIGIEPFLSTMPRLRVGNVGVEGATSTGWINQTSPGIGPLDAIKAYAADMHVIMLGTNDQTADVPVNTFLNNMLTLAEACAVSGDVAIASPWPTQASTNGSLSQQYAAALPAFCASHGYGYIPLFEAMGGINAYSNLNPLGYYNDVTHPSDIGYAAYSRLYYEALSRGM